MALRGGWGLFRKGYRREILLRLTYKAYVEDEEDTTNVMFDRATFRGQAEMKLPYRIPLYESHHRLLLFTNQVIFLLLCSVKEEEEASFRLVNQKAMMMIFYCCVFVSQGLHTPVFWRGDHKFTVVAATANVSCGSHNSGSEPKKFAPTIQTKKSFSAKNEGANSHHERFIK
nr:tricalbin-3-like [Tanacetum cinerariifolium]